MNYNIFYKQPEILFASGTNLSDADSAVSCGAGVRDGLPLQPVTLHDLHKHGEIADLKIHSDVSCTMSACCCLQLNMLPCSPSCR